MKKIRPINMELTSLVFPPMAVASILHRLSGVILFLTLPWLLYLLSLSVRDMTSFTELELWLANPFCKGLLWLAASASLYHLIAGVRHLAMDLGWGESLQVGRWSALAVIGLGVVGAIVLGIRIW